MKKLINKIYSDHLDFWNKKRGKSFMLSTILLLSALLIQKFADDYVAGTIGIPVGDIFLNHLPTVDIDFLIIQGALILTFIIIALLLIQPKYLNFTVKALALFIIIRSFFISLTHLGVNANQLPLDVNSTGFWLYNILYNSKGDFFFSGHTGLPFLMALIFWQEKFWRYLFLAVSFILGVSVLLAHIHYSIDVFAAPFMTYSIFALTRLLWPDDLPDKINP